MADGSSVYRHHSRTWSDERTDQLKAMWAEGLSASQIAKELGGVTRNAVLGKACRLGLPSRDASQAGADRSVSPKPSAPRRFKPAGSPQPPLPEVRAFVIGENPSPSVTPAQPIPDEPDVGGRTLTSLRFGECRWPQAMVDGEWTFCGCKAVAGRPYCGPHQARAVRPPTPGRKKQSANDLARSLRRYL